MSTVEVATVGGQCLFLLVFVFGYAEVLSEHVASMPAARYLFLAPLFATVVLALRLLPPPFYTGGVLLHVAAVLSLRARWRLSWERSLVLCAYWPATVLLALRIFRDQEEFRRERIAREIMET